MTFWKWSKTAASNSNADSTINWAEGQAPGSVNDSARAVMAAAAKFRDDNNGSLDTAGSSTAYTITSNQVFTSLFDGLTVTAKMHAANGASPTLAIDGLTAKAIRVTSGVAIPSGGLGLKSIQQFVYDLTDDCIYVTGYFSDSFNATSAPDLNAIEALTGTGIPRRTGSNAWALDAGVTDLAATTANRLFGTSGAGASGLITLGNALTLASSSLAVNAASTAAQGAVQLADQAAMEAKTVNRTVTANIQHNHPGHPKFWAYATVSAGVPTLQTSENVTGITDSGVGLLTVTIATDFSSANWCCELTIQDDGTSTSAAGIIVSNIRQSTIASGSIELGGYNTGQTGGGSTNDPDSWHVCGFGDQ